jgi:outer membrane lipopolysaccharide assembly protein LptE/RlpB
MLKRTFIRFLSLLLISAVTTACGFKLAGLSSLPEPLTALSLVTKNFSGEQRDLLEKSLKRAGADVSRELLDTRALLSVSLSRSQDRILASSASNGRTVVRLSNKLIYSLKSVDGSVLVDRKTLRQQKDIELNSDNLHSSAVEKANVTGALEKALIDKLVLQLKRVKI